MGSFYLSPVSQQAILQNVYDAHVNVYKEVLNQIEFSAEDQDLKQDLVSSFSTNRKIVPTPMKPIKIPDLITQITHSGSPQEIAAYELQRKGFLTQEHLQTMRQLAKEGIELC